MKLDLPIRQKALLNLWPNIYFFKIRFGRWRMILANILKNVARLALISDVYHSDAVFIARTNIFLCTCRSPQAVMCSKTLSYISLYQRL